MSFVIEKEGVTYTFSDLTNVPENHIFLKNSFPNWEKETFQVFRRFANPEKTVIDVGAWIGLTAIWLSKHFKNVICIEADILSVKTLQNNLKSSDCDNCSIIDKAIYSEKTKIIFGNNKFNNSQLNSSMSQIKSSITSQQDYECETITLQEILQNVEGQDIGLIKVDIEGGEEHILRDLITNFKERNIPTYISFHYSWWNNKNIDSFTDLLNSIPVYNESFIRITNPVDYIKRNPFCSILFSFQE